jgi:uncharacterized metal-binding protein YceD (DUF177 family)
MEPLQEHTIAFTGLKDGEHVFQFMLDQPFFDASGEEEWDGGHVTVDVTLDKTSTLLVVHIKAHGPVQLRCDRCNGPLTFNVKGEQRQIFRLNGTEQYDDDELVSLDEGANSINLTHYIYECLRLALPIRHVHEPGQCDPEVEKVLSRLIVEHEPIPDPRWEVLKELKNQERKP